MLGLGHRAHHFQRSLGDQVIDPDIVALLDLENTVLAVVLIHAVLRIVGEPTVEAYIRVIIRQNTSEANRYTSSKEMHR